MNAQISELNVTIVSLNTVDVSWDEIIRRAAFREPPFELGTAEKGFRDAVVMETFCQFQKTVQSSSANHAVLVCDDKLLTTAVHDRLHGQAGFSICNTLERLETELNAPEANLL